MTAAWSAPGEGGVEGSCAGRRGDAAAAADLSACRQRPGPATVPGAASMRTSGTVPAESGEDRTRYRTFAPSSSVLLPSGFIKSCHRSSLTYLPISTQGGSGDSSMYRRRPPGEEVDPCNEAGGP